VVSQSAIICDEILSTALFSASQTSTMHCSTTTDRRIISQPRYMVVGRYKSKIPLLNHQNWIETTVSTHTRKSQHKRLRIATVSSNTMVPNLFVSAVRSTFDNSTAAHQRGGGDADCF